MFEIGTAIRIVRQAKGLRSGHLAREAGLSAPFLSLVERGDRQPSLRVLRRIAGALDVPPEALVLLAVSGEGHLRSDDEGICSLVASIQEIARAEEALRLKLSAKDGAGDTK